VAYGHILAGTIKTINHISTLRAVHVEAAEVFFREEVIPKTLNSITPRNTRSITNQGIGPRIIQKKSNKRTISDSKIDQGLDT
jgi:hypothetical protein